MPTPTPCRITGNILSIGLTPVNGLSLRIWEAHRAPRRVEGVVVVPEPVNVTVSDQGAVDFLLTPGSYNMTAVRGDETFEPVKINVPNATVAFLEQLLDAPSPISLMSAQLAASDAIAARDRANEIVAGFNADRDGVAAALVVTQAARDAAELSAAEAAASAASIAAAAEEATASRDRAESAAYSAMTYAMDILDASQSAKDNADRAEGNATAAAQSSAEATLARSEILAPMLQMARAFTDSQTRYVNAFAFQ